MNFTINGLFVARIYDTYGEVIDYTTHSDFVMLENIVRGDWEGCGYAKNFRIFNDKNEEILFDFVG